MARQDHPAAAVPDIPTFLAYARRGRNALWRYLLATPLAFLIAIILGVLTVLAALLSHIASPDVVRELSDPAHPTPFFLGVFISFALVLIGLVASVRLLHAKRFEDLLGRWRWRDFAFGAGLWCLAQVIATAADVLAAPGALRITASSATFGLVAAAAPALALQTFTEEVIFRGYFTQGLLLVLRRPLITSTASGLIFGAAHIPNGAPQALAAVLFGAVMAYAAIRTGSLALGFGAHLVNNLFGGIVVASDADVFKGAPALITEHATSLVWLDLGVEAVLLGLLAALVTRSPAARSAADLAA